jgi:hypothetical protein
LKIAPVHIFLLKYIFIVHRVHNKPAKSKTLEEEIGATSKAPKNAKLRFCGRYVCARGYLCFEGICKYIRQRLTGPLPIPQNHTVLNPEIGLYT